MFGGDQIYNSTIPKQNYLGNIIVTHFKILQPGFNLKSLNCRYEHFPLANIL